MIFEFWKAIPGFNGVYWISSRGYVKNILKGNLLKLFKNSVGYLRTALSINGFLVFKTVHRLVAKAFLLNPYNKPEVNHEDGDKANNDISNLKWMTIPENRKHAWDNGFNLGNTKF